MTILVAVNIPTGKVDEYTVRVSGLPALGGDVINRLNQDAAELFEKVDWHFANRQVRATMAYGKIERALQALRRALDVALKSDSTTIQFTDRYDRAKYVAPSGRVCVGSILEPSEVDSIVAASEGNMPEGKRARITRRRDGNG